MNYETYSAADIASANKSFPRRTLRYAQADRECVLTGYDCIGEISLDTLERPRAFRIKELAFEGVPDDMTAEQMVEIAITVRGRRTRQIVGLGPV